MRKILKMLIIVGILIALVVFVYFMYGLFFSAKTVSSGGVLINPIAQIILNNMDNSGNLNREQIIKDALPGFNEDYINYILISLGVGNLHRSPLTFENPRIEIDVGEIWSSEIVDGGLKTSKRTIENPDVIFKMTREEAIEALMSENIKKFMKDSVVSGRTEIEMIAGKTTLYSKGYLKLYEDLKS